jgi:hypothetical protein
LRIVSTGSCVPVSAATAAACATAAALVVDWLCTTSSAFATCTGVIDQPMRQPVIAYVFETPSTTMIFSRPSSLASVSAEVTLKPS